MNIWLNFGGDPDRRLDTGIVFRIRYNYDIGKAGLCCITLLALGGGMYCPSASSCLSHGDIAHMDQRQRWYYRHTVCCYFAPPPLGVRSIAISVSVCPLAYLKDHNAMRYVFSVLWMT